MPGRIVVLAAIDCLVSRGDASAVDEVVRESHRQLFGRCFHGGSYSPIGTPPESRCGHLLLEIVITAHGTA